MKNKPDCFTNIFAKITNIDNASMIVIGDFNLVVDPNMDHANNKIYHPKARDTLNALTEQLELIDPWRNRKPYHKKI